MLTKQQYDLLVYINNYTGEKGISPSFDEMKAALALTSKSGVHRLINCLVERGFLKRIEGKARALEVIKLPYSAALEQAQKLQNAQNTVQNQPQNKTENRAQQPVLLRPTSIAAMVANQNIVDIPLLGKIAAGSPIDAISHAGESITVPAHFLGKQECYALTIEGDSMVKAGIMDGDIVVIERCNTARNGDIIVALVDEAEVTLKRFFQAQGQITLIPENDLYEPLTLAANRVKIQGKIRSLLRNY
jgi:repressor LexA